MAHRDDDEDEDLKEEIAFHLRTETERRIAAGGAPQDARASAIRDFGNVPLIEEVTRGFSPRAARERLMQDVRFALRSLSRDMSFTALAVLMLALAIGATVSVFAVIDAVLMTPLSFPTPNQLVMVWERTPQGDGHNVVNAPNYVAWRTRNQAFEHIGAIGWIPLNVTGLGDAMQVDGLRVTAEFFDALAVPPVLGRTIRSGEDVAGGPRTAVLSYGFWQQRYGGAPDVLGRLLVVNGSPHEIVGVMPATFTFPGARAAELYIPLQLDLSALARGRNLVTVARMRPHLTLQQAQAEMERVAAETSREAPAMNQGYSATVVPLLEEAVGKTRRILWVLFGSVACLLLLAAANIANLMLMRASTRSQEMAVRLALGAGRWRLVHQLLVESLIVSGLGGVCGLALAMVVVPLVPSMFPPSFPLPRANEVTVDASVVVFTLLVSCGIGVLFAIFPALHAKHDTVSGTLRSSGRSIAGTHTRMRRGLVITEVALALVLAIGAGLMSRSLAELYSVNPGFEAERVLSLRMLLLPSKYLQPPQRVAFLREVLEQVNATPGVMSASSIHFLPLSGIGSSSLFYRSDRPAPDVAEDNGGDVSVIMPGYFRTMGIPLLQGRDFNEADRIDVPRVVIVNQAAALRMFPNESPVGKSLSIRWSKPDPMQFEIVGVARDVRTSALEKPVGPAIYITHSQEPSALATLVVRTVGAPASAAASVRAAIARVDPDQGVSEVQSLDALIASVTARPRVQATVSGAFGLLALIVASVGLYGVMAYGVQQRRREMGVRTALGASPVTLLRLVVREGLALAGVGIVAGVALALAASPLVNGVLYETRATDPLVFLGVVLTLMLVAVIASLVPAHRATRVDPVVVLRDE